MKGVKKGDLTIGVILLLGTVLAMLNQTALNPALPSIMVDLNVDAATVQWLASAYSLVNAIVIPLSAYLMGRFGTRRIFLASLACFTVGSFLGAISTNFVVVLIGRILQAICAGVNMPMMFAVLLLIFPREMRGTAMGIVTLAICCAPAIGPTVSGLLVDTVGWHGLFWFVTALAVILLVVAAVKLKPYGNFERITFDAPSVVLVALGLLLLLLGISNLKTLDMIAVALVCIVVGLVILGVFVKRQLKLETPLLNVRVLKSRDFRTAAVVVMLIQATLIGLNLIMPLYIQNILGYSALASGLIMLPGAVLGGLGSVLAGRLFDRYGVRKCVVPGFIIMLIGAIALQTFGLDTSLVFVTVAYVIILGALQYCNTPTNTWGVNSLDNRVIQHGTALTNTLNQVGASLSTAILMMAITLGSAGSSSADAVQQALDGQHCAFAVVLVMVALATVLAVCFVRDRKTEPSEAASYAMESMPVSGAQYLGMLTGQVMNADPYYVRDTATVREAAVILMEKKTGGVPVVDAQQKVVGFVSDGDIMKYIGQSKQKVLDSTYMLYLAPEDAPFDERVRELLDLNVMTIATSKVVSIDGSTPVESACTLLADSHIKKLPVTSDGKLAGTLSRADIVRATMSELVSVGTVTEKKAEAAGA